MSIKNAFTSDIYFPVWKWLWARDLQLWWFHWNSTEFQWNCGNHRIYMSFQMSDYHVISIKETSWSIPVFWSQYRLLLQHPRQMHKTTPRDSLRLTHARSNSWRDLMFTKELFSFQNRLFEMLKGHLIQDSYFGTCSYWYCSMIVSTY